MADGSSSNQTYAYDPLNRLKSVTEKRNGTGSDTFNQTFDYDRWGNRKINAGLTFNAPEPPVDVQTTSNRVYAPATSSPYFAGDIALLGSDPCNPASTQRKICFDAVGNMTRDKHSINAGVMVYDAENRLVSHSAESGYPPTLFSYDGNGRRVNMQSGEYSTTFVYGLGGELMYETGKSVLKHYGYRSGQLLVTVSSVTRFPDVRWLVADHLGTPRIVLDQNGTKTRHDYLPFGEEIGSSVGGRSASYGYSYPQSDGVKQQFTGYERDIETGLDFAQARYFGNSLGRFTSPDPYNIVLESQAENNADDARAKLNNYLSKPQQWNRYVYVINNPLNYTDPTGEILELTGTHEERDRAFKRLQDLVGKDAGLGLQTSGGRTFVIYNNRDDLRKSAGDVGQVLADIIGSKTTVEFQVTDKNTVVNALGETLNLNDRGGAVTTLVSRDRSQIFINDNVAATAGFNATRSGGENTEDGMSITFTFSTAVAHEFGHAWGGIKDGTYGVVTNRHYPRAKVEAALETNKQRSLQVENFQRDRLGLSRRTRHP